MSDNPETPLVITVTVEQLCKLLQQHLTLWTREDGLKKVYSQATGLAQRIDQAFYQHPGKWLAQLQHYKPNYDYVTNLTLKATIFTAIEVAQQGWTPTARTSIIAATLTANIAVLKTLNKQAQGALLSDKSKATLTKAVILSYKLLKQNKVANPLWLHAISSSIPSNQRKSYSLDVHGAIVSSAYRFAKPLCRPKAAAPLTVVQVLKQVYLEGNHFTIEQIVDNAAHWIHPFSDGALVLLQNNQLAMIMHTMNDEGYLAFLFPAKTVTTKGRFVVIVNKHIHSLQPCFSCDEFRLYSQLWGAPLERYAAEKQIKLVSIDRPEADIFTPPKMLSDLVGELFEQPDLNKISEQINQSVQLTQLLTATASEAANKDVQITDVKHALAMLGLNRIGPLLTLGALADIVVGNQFPGLSQVESRKNCFIQAVKYYGQFNDSMSVEELCLYVFFWIAPLYMSDELQVTSCHLYKQKTIAVEDAFAIEKLFGLSLTEQHKKQVSELAESWQLPKVCIELHRQLSNPNTTIRSAKKIDHALAVLRLAALHTHTIFNQVDVNSPFLQQVLLKHLDMLGISLTQYLAHQDKFLAHYSPFTPLL